jgi:hypothetical protein
MDLLRTFIASYCLVGMDTRQHLYRCGGCELKIAFNQVLTHFGYKTFGAKVFYALLREFVSGVEGGGVVKNREGYVILGVTMTNRIETRNRVFTLEEQGDAKIRHGDKINLNSQPAQPVQSNIPIVAIPAVVAGPIVIPPMATLSSFDMAPYVVPLANLGIRPSKLVSEYIPPTQKSNVLGILPMSPVEETINPPIQIRLRVVKPKPEGILWDGSHLGRLGPDRLFFYSKSDVTHIKYYLLNHQGFSVLVTRKRTTTMIPNIIDEIKGLFQLPKIGTHSCVAGRSYRYVLRRVATTADGSGMVEDFNITKVPEALFTPALIISVRELFAFRELLGVTNTQESSIIAREVRNDVGRTIQLVSTDEPSIDISGNLVISDLAYEKWFPECIDDCPISSIIIKMIGVDNPVHIAERLAWLRSGISEVINRIDRQEIGMLNSIMERASNRVHQIYRHRNPEDDRQIDF